MIELGFVEHEDKLRYSRRLSRLSELSKGQTEELIPAGEIFDVAICPGTDRRKLERQRFLLLGSVPLVWPLLSSLIAKSLRDIEACLRAQQPKALSYGLPGPSFSQHVGTRQRTPRLADLRRFRPSLIAAGSRPLPWRIFWSGTVRDRVCPRLHDHRFVSVAFPVGKISPPQGAR